MAKETGYSSTRSVLAFLRLRAKWVVLSSVVGLFAGVSAAAFLFLLDHVTALRENHPQWIWGLPVGGLLSGYLYWRFGKGVSGGNGLILDAIHDPQKVVPFRMAPLILCGTLLTHLFGGSAGREGAAVQMSASLSAQLARWFPMGLDEKRILLMAGMGAGFGATVGVPWAGSIFGLEVIRSSRFRILAFLECGIASFVGYGVTQVLQAPHPHLPAVAVPDFLPKTWLAVAFTGWICGWFGRLFVTGTHAIQNHLQRFVKDLALFPPLMTAGMGAVVAGLSFWEGSFRYAGLGLSTIRAALEGQTSVFDPLGKLVLTALTVGAGFKGGEYVPLVFMGATLGNSLGPVLGVSPQFLAAVGYVAVFAGASKTPLACSALAMGLFGFTLGPYALLACGLSAWVSGDLSIYGHRR